MVSKMRVCAKAQKRIYKKKILCLVWSCFYIAGFLFGQACFKEEAFFAAFVGINTTQMNSADWKSSFSDLFLSQSSFLIILLFAGLSAVGVLLIPLLFAAKGLAFGVTASAFVVSAGKAGLLRLWLFHWLPEGVLLLLLLYQALAIWPLSENLAKICFFSKAGSVAGSITQKVIRQFLLLQLILIVLCFGTVQFWMRSSMILANGGLLAA